MAHQYAARAKEAQAVIVKQLNSAWQGGPEKLQPQFKKTFKLLQAATDPAVIQSFLQASKQSEKPDVHFDAAYSFRSALRDAALQQAERDLHSVSGTGPPAPDLLEILGPGRRPTAEAWAAAGLSKEAWPDRALMQEWRETWQIDIGDSADRYIDNPLALEASVSMANTIINTYSEPHKTPEWRLILAPSTLHFLHTQRVIRTLRENRVCRAEIDGWHKLDTRLGSRAGMGVRGGSALLACLCKQHVFMGIGHGTFPYGHLTLRFLKGLDNREIFGRRHKEYWNKELPGIRHKMLYGPEMIGIDIRSPEGSFQDAEIIEDIYEELIELAALRRRDREHPLVLRIHVGECNSYNMQYNEKVERKARRNVQMVLDVVKDLQDKEKLSLRKVSIRLGHVTAMTLSQAFKIRKLGLHFELNSSSNLCARAAEHRGHLPVVKVLVAEALWQMTRRHTTPWLFTCNTDGGGIMQCTLTEDYLLSLSVAHEFVKGGSGSASEAAELCIAAIGDVELLLENQDRVLTSQGVNKLEPLQEQDDNKSRTSLTWLKVWVFKPEFKAKMKEILLKGFALQLNHPYPRLAGGYLDQ